jgi:hypothetical protein
MATIREYFDVDFNYAVRVKTRIAEFGAAAEIAILYDFNAQCAFISSYLAGDQHTLPEFCRLLEALQPGKSQVVLDGHVNLPSARLFPGRLEVKNGNPFELKVKFHGDPEWISISEMPASTRVFLYSESRLSEPEILELKQVGRTFNQRVQFRSADHARARSLYEAALAFISHDSRDKDQVARKIAISLQGKLCPVWYDEFSLEVGANLRDSIETGLKKCKKCILILSPNFFSNAGWTKREFDSIFTREILEQTQLVLPVWYGVTKKAVYDYSPSLLNVKGLDWNQLGEEEVCRLLYRAILNE